MIEQLANKVGENMIQALSVNILSVFFSLIILSIYQFNNSILDLNLIKSILQKNSIMLLAVLTISTISLYLYNSDKKYLKKSKNRFSLKLFRYISVFIHISTIVIVCDSLFIDNFLDLEFHDNLLYMYVRIFASKNSCFVFARALR